jgi:hypothetical protein
MAASPTSHTVTWTALKKSIKRLRESTTDLELFDWLSEYVYQSYVFFEFIAKQGQELELAVYQINELLVKYGLPAKHTTLDKPTVSTIVNAFLSALPNAFPILSQFLIKNLESDNIRRPSHDAIMGWFADVLINHPNPKVPAILVKYYLICWSDEKCLSRSGFKKYSMGPFIDAFVGKFGFGKIREMNDAGVPCVATDSEKPIWLSPSWIFKAAFRFGTDDTVQTLLQNNVGFISPDIDLLSNPINSIKKMRLVLLTYLDSMISYGYFFEIFDNIFRQLPTTALSLHQDRLLKLLFFLGGRYTAPIPATWIGIPEFIKYLDDHAEQVEADTLIMKQGFGLHTQVGAVGYSIEGH